MWPWVDRLAPIILDAGLSATLLLGLVSLAMVFCRQPARRVHVARSAILCSLVLLPIVVLGPIPRIDLVAVLEFLDLLPQADGPPHVPPLGLDNSPPGLPSDLVAWASSLSTPWPARVVAIGYLAGLSYQFAGLVLGCCGLVWLARRSTEPSDSTRTLYDALPYSRRKRPELRVSNRVGRPVLIGTCRQVILIPAGFEASGDIVPLRLSLLHELAHSESADPWFSLLASVSHAFWFFVPPLWWIRTQLRIDHEFLADRHAARVFGPLRSYAASLVEIAHPPSRPFPMAMAPAGRPTTSATGLATSALVQRVMMLVRCPFPVERRPPEWWRWSLPCLVLAATLGTSSFCLRLPTTRVRATDPTAAVRSPDGRSFRLSTLTLAERPASDRGRVTPFDLPVRLPDNFDLSLEIWGNPALLATTRVVGLALPQPSSAHREGHVEPPPTWHTLLVHRCRDGLTISLDGEPTASPRSSGPLSAWLSIEPPPNRKVQVRGLILTW